MALLFREMEVPHRRVFADTGWESLETYDYIEYLETVLGKIDVVRNDLQMVDLIKSKQFFPKARARFCTTDLKLKPLMLYFDQDGGEVVNAIGVRASESRARQALVGTEVHPDTGIIVHRPVLAWSVDDVIRIHRRHAVPMNPLYALGCDRVGCWPCVFASKRQVRAVADNDPSRIGEIRALEDELAYAKKERWKIKGKAYSRDPSFFHHRLPGGEAPTIDNVVSWSRTSHGGRQYEMVPDVKGSICHKYGFCE